MLYIVSVVEVFMLCGFFIIYYEIIIVYYFFLIEYLMSVFELFVC